MGQIRGKDVGGRTTSLEAAERFVAFQYEQMKDLTKHFLTLIAGTLVLTVSFAEKILPIARDHPHQPLLRQLLALCFFLLFLAFALAGAGLAGMFLSAIAAREGRVFSSRPVDYLAVARPSYVAIDVGGVAFVVALGLLATLGALRLLS